MKIEDCIMQDIREVLRNKEEQLERLQKEIEALRLSVRILEEDEKKVSTVVSTIMIEPTIKKDGAKTMGSRQFP